MTIWKPGPGASAIVAPAKARRALSKPNCGRLPTGQDVAAGRAVPDRGAAPVTSPGAASQACRQAHRASQRRVIVKARIVRHRGPRFTAAPLAKHLTYLKRDGVTRDGKDAALFGSGDDTVDGGAFAERCADDRHHFRFIVSPEDTAELADVRSFTR